MMKMNKPHSWQNVNKTKLKRIRGITDEIIYSVDTTKSYLYVREWEIGLTLHVVGEKFPTPVDDILESDFIAK